MEYKFIARVGVELEGGWDTPPERLTGDGSVRGLDTPYRGECATPIPGVAPRSIKKWMLEHYPTAVNGTCGMHVHVSLKKLSDYRRCMEPEFNDLLLVMLKEWGERMHIISQHPFWARLKGEWQPDGFNYCAKEFKPEAQIWHKQRHGDRYCQINYTWSRYGTIEVRVLPMFKIPDIAVSAVVNLLKVFETFLTQTVEDTTEDVCKVAVDTEDGPVENATIGMRIVGDVMPPERESVQLVQPRNLWRPDDIPNDCRPDAGQRHVRTTVEIARIQRPRQVFPITVSLSDAAHRPELTHTRTYRYTPSRFSLEPNSSVGLHSNSRVYGHRFTFDPLTNEIHPRR